MQGCKGILVVYQNAMRKELIKELQNHVKKVTATKTLKEDFFYGDIGLCPYISYITYFSKRKLPLRMFSFPYPHYKWQSIGRA